MCNFYYVIYTLCVCILIEREYTCTPPCPDVKEGRIADTKV
jgi:hypothetical protein